MFKKLQATNLLCEVIGHLISLLTINIQLKKHLAYITANVPSSLLTEREADQAVLAVDCIDQAS